MRVILNSSLEKNIIEKIWITDFIVVLSLSSFPWNFVIGEFMEIAHGR